MDITLTEVAGALAGGAIGAALGGLLVFALMGVLCLASVGAVAAGASAALVSGVALGPVFGPHVAFAGAVAAAAYAADRGDLETGRDIVGPLVRFGKPAVLAIGAAFGLLGFLTAEVVAEFAATTASDGALVNLTDPLAVGVVVPGIVAWLMWGRTPIDRQSWLPWQHTPAQVVSIGLAFAAMAGAVTLAWPEDTQALAPVALFGFSALTLIGFQAGQLVPVSHHITLPAASGAVLTLGLGGTEWMALLVATLTGVLTAIIAEGWSRLFLERSRVHLDPLCVRLR